ncbi:MAG: hypothetical protein AAFQ07_08070 [Chloroflexota bacterium]
MEFFGVMAAGLIALVSGAVGYYEVRRVAKIAQLIARFEQMNPLYLSDRWTQVQYIWQTPRSTAVQWRRGILVVTDKRVAIYDYAPAPANDLPEPIATLPTDTLRGFWRPEKYTPGINEMWIHSEQRKRWYLLKVRLRQYEMQALVRAMKEISTEEQVTTYRRRRPYHHLLTDGQPAKQTLTGAWELSDPLSLYIMPLMLVVMRAETVLETVELAHIQDIAALKRMEGGEPAGLVRFTIVNPDETSEQRAFGIARYEEWAEILAEAAKRTLEEPVERKRKGKEDEAE